MTLACFALLSLYLSVGTALLISKEEPFYLHGFLKYPGVEPKNWDHLTPVLAEKNLSHWVLPSTLLHPTRNHDSLLLEYQGRQLLISMLGRYSRYVQMMDLRSGEQWAIQTSNIEDPDGFPLDDLNHVFSVLVDAVDENGEKTGKKEVWLPCGFNGDAVNSEQSVRFARIIDLDTLKIRLGPELPIAGGACVAEPLTILPNEPPMICTFGGTLGSHDQGTFLPYASCYDRIRQKWWFPFGKMPLALDHGSISVTPKNACKKGDPSRLLILNFRTESYGVERSEMLGFDMPKELWTLSELQTKGMEDSGPWYIYHNVTYNDFEDVANSPRDASGTVTMDQGRKILNFGGIHYHHGPHKVYSVVRSFDVCNKEWSIVGDLGIENFALQTVASQELQICITCGGFVYGYANSPWCLVTRPNDDGFLINRHENIAMKGFPAGYFPGKQNGLPHRTRVMKESHVTYEKELNSRRRWMDGRGWEKE